MQRLFRNTDTNTVWSVSAAVLGWVTGTQSGHLASAGYTITNVSDAAFRTVLKHHAWDPDTLPDSQGVVWTRFFAAADIPVTVQGASEQFITNTMQQVVVNTNTVGSQLSAVVSTCRDQVKTHVTTETNRVIAAL